MPQILDFATLAGVSDATLAGIRRLARIPLLKHGFTPDEVSDIMHKIVCSDKITIAEITTEPWDDHQTTNSIVPLKTDRGTIELVVNGAWGVNWRLGQDHMLGNGLAGYGNLTQVQRQEPYQTGQPSEDKYFVAPEVLEQAANTRENPRSLAHHLKAYLQKLLQPGFTLVLLDDNKVIFTRPNCQTCLCLGLEDVSGLKSVKILSREGAASDNKADQFGWDLAKRIERYQSFS